MTRGVGVEIDGHAYNLVNDHETYVVTDVPSHPDSDGRMERRVIYDHFTGISHRREAHSIDTQQGLTSNIYTRMVRNAEQIWWANGLDTRTVDRIFAQRATTVVSPNPVINGFWRWFVDAGLGKSVLIGDTAIWLSSFNATTGAQTTTGFYDLQSTPGLGGAIWGTGSGSPALNQTVGNPGSRRITDVAVFNQRVFVAATATASDATAPGGIVNNFNIPQKYCVWDQGPLSPPLESPLPLTAPSAPTVGLGATPAGTKSFKYFIVGSDGQRDSSPSQIQPFVTGPNVLDATHTLTITMPAAYPPGVSFFRLYRGPTTLETQTNMVGLIQGSQSTGLAAGAVYLDNGILPTAEYLPTTPGFAVGDVGNASAFVVIRDTLWRAAGSFMWALKTGNGSWSATQHIGDPTTSITALDVFEDDLVIYKPDGLWTMDRGGNVFPLFPGVKLPGLNPRPLAQWRGKYYFAADFGMVWEYDGDKVVSIGFDKSEPYPMSKTMGLPNASTRGIPLPNFMLVGFNQANSTANVGYIFAWDGTGWHPFQYNPTGIVTAMGIGGVSQLPNYPVLQLGFGTFSGSSTSMSYLTQPTLDPLLTTNYDARPQVVYFPVDNGVVADEFKILESVRVDVDNPLSGTVRLAYAVDDNIATLNFTDMGSPIGDKQLFQTFALDTAPQYRKVLLRMTITPNGDVNALTASKTPVVRALIQRYKQREFQRRAWKLSLFLEEGQMTTRHNRDARTSQTMLDQLNAARQNKKLVIFKDILGKEHSVYVQSVGESIKAFRVRNNTTTFVCEVTLVEASSIVSN